VGVAKEKNHGKETRGGSLSSCKRIQSTPNARRRSRPRDALARPKADIFVTPAQGRSKVSKAGVSESGGREQKAKDLSELPEQALQLLRGRKNQGGERGGDRKKKGEQGAGDE